MKLEERFNKSHIFIKKAIEIYKKSVKIKTVQKVEWLIIKKAYVCNDGSECCGLYLEKTNLIGFYNQNINWNHFFLNPNWYASVVIEINLYYIN